MKYAIQNTSGQWWTGECWGVLQAREEYDLNQLPVELPVSNLSDNTVDLVSPTDSDKDCVYCDPTVDPGNDIVASLRPIREAGDPL